MRTLKIPNYLYDTFVIFLDTAQACFFKDADKFTPKELKVYNWINTFVRREEIKSTKKKRQA